MTLSKGDKETLSNIRMARALEFLDDAKSNLDDSLKLAEEILEKVDGVRKKLISEL